VVRKPREIKRIEFSIDELTSVVASMEGLAVAGDGWINLLPKINDDDERPSVLGFFTLFSGGGTGVTMCTWIPASRERRGRNQPSIGITHATGRRVVAQLGLLGFPVPATWFVEQDHPRRGLVMRVPADEPNEEVLTWALRATEVLSVAGPIRAWWADMYLPTPS
jgi:hypothetical protein